MNRPKAFSIEPAWRSLLKDLGVSEVELLRRAQLPEDLFSRTEASLNTADYFRLWRTLEAEVKDSRFPIILAEIVKTESFVPPLFAALCSPDLRVALERLADYKRLIAPMALTLTSTPAALEVSLQWLDTELQPPTSLVATELAFLVRLARIATREHVRPTRVTTPSPPEPARAYTEFFGVPVETGAAHSLSFSEADVRLPFLTANEALWEAFEPELRRRLGQLRAQATTRERVRAVLLENLPSGRTSMDAMAARLGMSKRTLQRRLSDEGTSFQALLTRTREDLARHYLERTAIPCAEISFLLGFEDPNSFFRAFHEWTGNTPEQLRRASLS